MTNVNRVRPKNPDTVYDAMARRVAVSEALAEDPLMSGNDIARATGYDQGSVSAELRTMATGVGLIDPGRVDRAREKQLAQIDLLIDQTMAKYAAWILDGDPEIAGQMGILGQFLVQLMNRQSKLLGLDAPKRVNILSVTATLASQHNVDPARLSRKLAEVAAEQQAK